ncbi:MAG: gliding motility-associated C-terminal domain-containing protein [Saprospiraceae bacterium]|nr:gliding motility-associated C-terminal domain-containing protein [Saprospiraceae bacterium]
MQHLLGQSLPDCNGINFRVLEVGGASLLQEISIDDETENYMFRDLMRYPGRRLNAISYYVRQGIIYGLDINEGLTLIQILPNFEVVELREINVPRGLAFVAADIDQINGLMYILGYNMNEPESLLLQIDLKASDFNIKYLPVFSENSVACADLVYQPARHSLIGFDHKNQELVEIQILPNRAFASMIMHSNLRIQGGIPSLFYNKDSELLGIGSDEMLDNYNIYGFSVEEKKVNVRQVLTYENNQDACSCLSPVIFTNKVMTVENSSCHLVTFEYSLVNLKDEVFDEVILKNRFPDSLIIESFIGNQGFETIEGGAGFSFFEIRFSPGIEGPIQLKLQLKVLDSQMDTIFYNQAEALISDKWMVSDNPRTIAVDDATDFRLVPFMRRSDSKDITLCQGDTVTLRPEISDQVAFQWSDGVTTRDNRVSDPGLYTIKVSDECMDYSATFWVEEKDISVELGESIEVEEYEEISIVPDILNEEPAIRYFWTADRPGIDVCATCQEQSMTAREDFKIRLQVITEDGCTADAVKDIYTKALKVYRPNAFTPNGDGVNDFFQLYSDRDFLLKDLQVFNRWGQLVYQQHKMSASNDMKWDGKIGNATLDAGVYIWKAILVKKGGRQELIQGEVNLVF